MFYNRHGHWKALVLKGGGGVGLGVFQDVVPTLPRRVQEGSRITCGYSK
jgi:hypothetical protein